MSVYYPWNRSMCKHCTTSALCKWRGARCSKPRPASWRRWSLHQRRATWPSTWPLFAIAYESIKNTLRRQEQQVIHRPKHNKRHPTCHRQNRGVERELPPKPHDNPEVFFQRSRVIFISCKLFGQCVKGKAHITLFLKDSWADTVSEHCFIERWLLFYTWCNHSFYHHRLQKLWALLLCVNGYQCIKSQVWMNGLCCPTRAQCLYVQFYEVLGGQVSRPCWFIDANSCNCHIMT